MHFDGVVIAVAKAGVDRIAIRLFDIIGYDKTVERNDKALFSVGDIGIFRKRDFYS